MIEFAMRAVRLREHFGSPPPAGTLNSPVDESEVAITMVPSDPQVAPRAAPVMRHTVMGDPPLTEILLSSLPLMKPIDRPSGEKNGVRVCAVPDSGTASS